MAFSQNLDSFRNYYNRIIKVFASTHFTDELNKLNDEQKLCVNQTNRGSPILVSAEAGTGKTRTLIARITKLVGRDDVKFNEICILTYTNTAKDEIKNRLNVIFPGCFRKDIVRPVISTFHSFAYSNTVAPSEIEEKKKRNFLNRQLENNHLLHLSKYEYIPKLEELRYRKHIKNEDVSDEELFPVLEKYEQHLTDKKLTDYTQTMITLYKRITDSSTTFKFKNLGSELKNFLIDEFQDQNLFSFSILSKLDLENSFIIGDPNQKIYSFSSIPVFVEKELVKLNANTTLLTLKENHRCHKNIRCAYLSLLQEEELNVIKDSYDRDDPRVLVTKRQTCFESHDLVWEIVSGLSVKNKTCAILFRKNKTMTTFESLANEKEVSSRNYDKLTLSTAHSAKGKEYDVVIIPYFVETVFPLYKPSFVNPEKDLESIAEEKRLTYVALSRAKELVQLICPSSFEKLKSFNGMQVRTRPPSSFINLIAPFYHTTDSPIDIMKKVL